MTWLDDITDSLDMNLSKLQEIVKNREVWRTAVHRVSKCQKNTNYGDAEAEALILWPPDAKNQLIGKDPDVGKN